MLRLVMFVLTVGLTTKKHKFSSKLNTRCFVIRRLSDILNADTLRTVYFRSLINCGIIFWGNSTNMRKFFLIRGRMIRI